MKNTNSVVNTVAKIAVEVRSDKTITINTEYNYKLLGISCKGTSIVETNVDELTNHIIDCVEDPDKICEVLVASVLSEETLARIKKAVA